MFQAGSAQFVPKVVINVEVSVACDDLPQVVGGDPSSQGDEIIDTRS